MIHEAYMPVYMGSRFSLRAGGSTRGSTRGPRGPKKFLILGQNQLFGYYFMTLAIIELFQKSYFHRSSLTTRS